MIKCQKCESEDIIKRGFNLVRGNSIQKYQCKSCRRIFSFPDRLPNNHLTSEIVSLCIDLYLKGLSYRVIKQQLLEQFNIKVSHVTIYYWMKNYTNLIKKYVDTLDINLSAVWQMDETVIKFKGKGSLGTVQRNRWYWCWTCVDTVTRFSVDMYLADGNNHTDGLEFFQRIKSTIKDEPEVVATDGNRAYIRALKTYYPNAIHLPIKQISIKPNTSFIERFNGTIKNRTKVMRGFAQFVPCQNWLTLFQIYYNFLRPHMSLNNKTPAQTAGVTEEFPHRWISLIRNAMNASSQELSFNKFL